MRVRPSFLLLLGIRITVAIAHANATITWHTDAAAAFANSGLCPIGLQRDWGIIFFKKHLSWPIQVQDSCADNGQITDSMKVAAGLANDSSSKAWIGSSGHHASGEVQQAHIHRERERERERECKCMRFSPDICGVSEMF